MVKIEKIKLENKKFFGLDQDSFYVGEVLNNKPHGSGKLTFLKVDTNEYDPYFDGIFHEGLPIEGKFLDCFGRIFDGKFDKANTENGNGQIIYKDGTKYVGEWYKFEKIGEGIMSFNNNVKFSGSWHENFPSKGVMTYSDGTKYEGWFIQFSYDFGGGKIIYPDGSKFESGFNEDNEYPKVEFEGKMFHPNSEEAIEGTLQIANVFKYKDFLGDDAYDLFPSKNDKFVPKK